MEKELLIYLGQWGPGLLILIGFYLLLRRFLALLPTLMRSHQERIDRQTQVLTELKEVIRLWQGQQSVEHREMLLLLRYISQKVKEMEERGGGSFGY